MSICRTVVEWNYKDLKQQFTVNDFLRFLKVRQAIALIFKTSVVLWNMKVCMYCGGQVGELFKCKPPPIQDYLLRVIENEYNEE